MIYETHAHYDDGRFDGDRRELLSQLPSLGIGRVINVAASIPSIDSCVTLSKDYDYIYAALGVHPGELCPDGGEEGQGDAGRSMDDIIIERIRSLANPGNKVVAIGEIGLDYNWDKDPARRENQRYWFRRQLRLAHELNLPVIIHSRDAAEDTMEIMKEVMPLHIPGVIHCYSYSPEMAREYVKMGYHIGVGGIVTFKNAKKLVQTVEEIPLERLLLETDSPYLAPEPKRGTRNDSRNLCYIADRIAELKNITREEVENATWNNAERLFNA